MKNIILIVCLLTYSTAFSQKKSNVFATAEFLKQTGASLFYNHTIKHSKFGIGAGIQAVNFKVTSDYSVLADFRYYASFGKVSLIPNVQTGKNFGKVSNIFNPNVPTVLSNGRGGFHVNLSMGYSYPLYKHGAALYINTGIRSFAYNYFSEGKKYDTKVFSDFLFSVGLRF